MKMMPYLEDAFRGDFYYKGLGYEESADFQSLLFIIFWAMFVLNSQTDQQPQTTVEVRENKTPGESINPSQRKTGTIVVKFSAQDAKKFIVSADPNSKGIKMKLPLKLKLASDPANPSSKVRAKLVLDQDALDKEIRQESIQAVSKNGIVLKSQPANQPYLASLAVQASQGQLTHSAIPLEEFDDFFTEVPPAEEPFNSPWKSLCDFFLAINEQLAYQPGYSALLDVELIEKMQLEQTRLHFNFEQIQQLLSLILDYLALSKNYSHGKEEIQPLPTRLQLRNFAQVLGADWRHLKQEVFQYNKKVLKVLDYIQPKCQGEGSRYTHCYFNLNFDMSYEQVEIVAEAVKYQCRYNSKAFCFLTNYLLTSCLNKEKMQNACIRHIESTLVSTINKLIKDHPSSYSLQGGSQLLYRHQTFKVDPSLHPSKTLNLRNVPRDQKIAVLQRFIQLRAKEAQLNSGAFARLIKDICSRSGSNLLTDVKIKSMRTRRAIERVKEKILDGISHKHRAQLLLDVNPNLSVNAYTDAELEQYRHHINDIFLSLDGPIEFGVDDLLRGRCMFSSLDSLNNCCQELKEEIAKRGYTLLSLKNRLYSKQCDIVMHIRIGETIAEVQLMLNYKMAQNQFSFNLEHLRDAAFYNHITHLKNINQKLTYLFLEEAFGYIWDNTKPCSNKEYNEKTNFKATKDNLERFIRQLPFKLDRTELNVHEIELPVLAAEVKRFQEIVKCPIGKNIQSPEKLKNNGDFLYQLGIYDLSLQNQAKYCQNMEALYHHLLQTAPQSPQRQFSASQRQIIKNYAGAVYVLGKVHMRAKTYESAVKYLQLSQRLTQLLGNRDQYYVETWQHLGEIERRRHNLSKASDIYNKLVRFQESSAKCNSEQYVQTLQALALINQQQTNYEEAIKLLKKIIPIIQKQKGKEHIQLATVYNNLGATYNLDGKLAQSLTAYRTSLAIIQKQKGKNSVDCASVAANIGLIYETDYNYYEASKYYEQALSICSKHNLKEKIYANAAFGLGKCYSQLGNFSKAIDTYRKALQYFQKDKGDLYYATNYEIKKAYEALGEDTEPSQLSVDPSEP